MSTEGDPTGDELRAAYDASTAAMRAWTDELARQKIPLSDERRRGREGTRLASLYDEMIRCTERWIAAVSRGLTHAGVDWRGRPIEKKPTHAVRLEGRIYANRGGRVEFPPGTVVHAGETLEVIGPEIAYE